MKKDRKKISFNKIVLNKHNIWCIYAENESVSKNSKSSLVS